MYKIAVDYRVGPERVIIAIIIIKMETISVVITVKAHIDVFLSNQVPYL